MNEAGACIRCPTCGGPTALWSSPRRVDGQNVIERERQCAHCPERFRTFEVVEGTVITWQADPSDDASEPDTAARVSRIEAAPPARALKSQTAVTGEYENCRGCDRLFKRRKGGPRRLCRECAREGVLS